MTKLTVLVLHVECPDHFMGSVNHKNQSNRRANVHVFQTIDHRSRAVLNEQRVDDDERKAKLRRSEFQITDLQTISGGKCEKRAHLVTREDGEHDQDLVAGALGEDEGVSDYDRAQEKVVEEMIHVIAPSHQTRAPILPDFAVVVIGHILQCDHRRDSPEPAQVIPGQIGEKQDEPRPHERQHRQVVSFQPGRNSGQNSDGEPALERGQEGIVALARAGKLLSFDHG